jgi:hypothetical protein
MKAPAASIRNLLVVVLVLSADFYLIRDRLDGDTPYPYFMWPVLFQFGFLGSLPMTNVVVIGGSLILSRGGERRAFLSGFVLVGAVAIAALLSLAVAIPYEWSRDLERFTSEITDWLNRRNWLNLSFRQQSYTIYRLAVFTVLLTIPEFLIATLGGVVARSRTRSARVWPPSITPPGQAIGLAD